MQYEYDKGMKHRVGYRTTPEEVLKANKVTCFHFRCIKMITTMHCVLACYVACIVAMMLHWVKPCPCAFADHQACDP